ncbi:hypothetical protein CTZ27_37960 [Streptomyces griseocarneus]|nr:hypothetical protein CTZ27_37960 [Streptomyces griseocarneus]
MIRHRIFALFATLAVMASMALGVAPTASATVSGVTCVVGTTHVTYSPGLQNKPRSVHFTENDRYTGCTSSDATIKTGETFSSFTTVLSCTQLLHTGTAPNPITWNNGQTSNLLLNFAATFVSGQVILTGTGTVTDGEFKGDSAKVVLTYAQPNALQCDSQQGLTSQSGTATVAINGS